MHPEHEPVSPLSYRPGEVFPELGQPGGEVSPLTPPKISQATFSYSNPRPLVRGLPVQPRKPVGEPPSHRKGKVASGRPVLHDPPSLVSIHPGIGHTNSEAGELTAQRPRSQTSRARGQDDLYVAPDFLQDHADHARAAPKPEMIPIPPTAPRRPRSQTHAPAPQYQRIPREGRSCAHCGRSQKGNHEKLQACNRCVNVWYCPNSRCWGARVCHNKSGQKEYNTLPSAADPRNFRSQQLQSRKEEKLRSQAPPLIDKRGAGIRARAPSKRGQPHRRADLESQKLAVPSHHSHRILWLILTAIVVILIIIIIAIAARH